MRFLILIGFTLYFSTGITQISSHAKTVDFGFGYGSLAPHKPDIRHLATGYALKGEMGITFRTQGEKYHHSDYKNPYYGLVYSLNNSGNTSQIGNTHALNFYGSLPFYWSENPISLRAGFGMGYVEKVFDKSTNPKNNAIGSHFNVNIQLRLEKYFRITKKQTVKLGIGVSHFSNALTKSPNLGLNFIHGYLSYGIHLKKYVPVVINEKPIAPVFSKYKLLLITGGGVKENETPLGNRFGVGVASLQFEHRKKSKYSYFTSLDFYANNALKKVNGKSFQFGLFVGFYKNFDKLKVGTGMGVYTINKPSKENQFYHKIIIEYWFNKKLFAQLLLKSHWAAADFFNATVGYRIK